ncbi:hypothetical protein [Paractinoplanes maris]|uniref:hypothetical protein n=1 Tax=Paractinoplanes maris TaxID=1734446 RepID=UPI00202001C1|nr:hypothetical protein [Actinoplanes maris]
MATTVHDVAILADFRFPDARVAPEVRTQADAALSTVLVHAPLPGDRRPLPFGPDIRDLIRDGVAVLARDDEPVTARLLVIRGRRPIVEDLPAVRAGRTVAVDDPGEAAGRSHLRWLAGFGIRPRISLPARTHREGPAPGRRMLIVGDDPEALGRLAAKVPGDLSAVLVSWAPGATAVPPGFLIEHIPPRTVLRDRLAHLIAVHQPAIVAVAGGPRPGLAEAIRDHPGVVWVSTGGGEGQEVFDRVVEPGTTWWGGLGARREIGG